MDNDEIFSMKEVVVEAIEIILPLLNQVLDQQLWAMLVFAVRKMCKTIAMIIFMLLV